MIREISDLGVGSRLGFAWNPGNDASRSCEQRLSLLHVPLGYVGCSSVRGCMARRQNCRRIAKATALADMDR